MAKKSLQRIEDFYLDNGYKGDGLRKALLKDDEYQGLLKERKLKLARKFPLTKAEERKYVMATDADYEILSKVNRLEKSNLSKEEKELVRLIRTQLELDWRKWLIKELDRLLEKHGKS